MPANSRQSRKGPTTAGEGPGRTASPDSKAVLPLLGGLLAPLLFVAAFTVQGALEPGYDPYTDYVSDLSLGRDGWIQVSAFIICGWLLLGFGVALCRLTEVSRAPSWSPAVFGFMGFGMIASGVFDTDPTWAHLTLHGELHYVSTAVTGGALMVGTISAWRDLCHDGRQGPAHCCLAIGLGCITLFLTSLVLPEAAVPGLMERLALGLGALWVAGFALSRLRTGPLAPLVFTPKRAELSYPVMNWKGKVWHHRLRVKGR